ncbi:MAG: NYN domain-containing protein [Myxococcota bacterium]
MEITKQASARVALFFDGRNFYSGWREAAQGRRVDFAKLAKWLVRQAGGTALAGSYYYTGLHEVAEDGANEANQRLRGFLEMLGNQTGFFVQTFQQKTGCMSCDYCGEENRYTSDKEVDVALTAQMLQLAAVDAFEAAVLMSGDADYAPALRSLRLLGKRAHIASWGGMGVSRRVRAAAFSHIDLLAGLEFFERGADMQSLDFLEGVDEPVEVLPFTGEFSFDAFMSEFIQAEKKFAGGFVGLGYFLNHWRSAHLDKTAQARRGVLDKLLVDSWMETYDIGGGNLALALSDRAQERLRELIDGEQPSTD